VQANVNMLSYIDILHIFASAMPEWAASSPVTKAWSFMLAGEDEIGPAGLNLLLMPSGL